MLRLDDSWMSLCWFGEMRCDDGDDDRLSDDGDDERLSDERRMDTKIPRLLEICYCTRWMGSGWRAGLMPWRGLVGFVLIGRNAWGGSCCVPVDPCHTFLESLLCTLGYLVFLCLFLCAGIDSTRLDLRHGFGWCFIPFRFLSDPVYFFAEIGDYSLLWRSHIG